MENNTNKNSTNDQKNVEKKSQENKKNTKSVIYEDKGWSSNPFKNIKNK